MRSCYTTLLLGITCAHAFTIGQVVNTTSGRFGGRLAPGSDGVSVYKGIPFAQPPVGDLRFAPPIRARFSPGTTDANTVVSCPANTFFGVGGVRALPFNILNQWGPIGQQQFDNIINADTSLNDEDCLRLTIWTKPQVGSASKPVMVWLYGGSFSYGSYGDPRYNGRYLVEKQDVVIVVINFRSNIFGFPGAPNTRQNLGWLDQRLAIEWLRDNIAAFGGDPKRMVFFGESSGAASMDYYALAWTKDPIISGIIAESGSIYGFPPNAKGSKVEAWRSVARKLGCFSIFGDDAVLKCMRSKSYQDILKANSAPAGYLGLLAALTFGPVVDDVVVFDDWADRFRSGRYIKVPRLTGTNDNEFNVISPGFTALNGFPLPPPAEAALSAKVFQCPCANQALDIVKTGVPLYRYRWFGYFPNTAFVVGNGATKAFHASEVAMVWGSTADFGVPNTPAQTAISDYLQTVWGAFARDPSNGLAQLGWPIYAASTRQIALLAYQNRSGFSIDQADKYDTGCALLGPPLSLLDIFTQLFSPFGPHWKRVRS